MSDRNQLIHKKRLEEFINSNIDYDGRVTITFEQDFAFYSQILPAPSQRQTANLRVLDTDMHHDLLQARVLNWCRTADAVFPLQTKSDGNCLCHAVSSFIWGIADDKLTLRKLINIAVDTDKNKRRWRTQYERQISTTSRDSMRLNGNDWEQEWKAVVMTAAPTQSMMGVVPYSHLEAIHIFTLAKILRRPIIVLADATARTLSGASLQESDIGGIYLPLDWPVEKCSKYPVVLAYNMNHFCPLLPQMTASTEKAFFTVPIVTHDKSSLPIRFLSDEEEKNAARILKSYLKVKEIGVSTTESMSLVLCTEIKYVPLPDHLRVFEQTVPSVPNSSYRPSALNLLQLTLMAPCITQGCKFYGSPATGNMCSECVEKYLQQAPAPRLAEPTAPPASMPVAAEYIDMSMMGETCKGGCGYRCSINTYPYCHECAERMRNQVSGSIIHPRSTDISENGPNAISYQEQGGFSEPHPMPSLDRDRGNNSQAQLGATSQARPSAISQSIMHSEDYLFGHGGSQQGLEQPETLTCTTEGCIQQAKAKLGGLCEKCYMRVRVELVKHICITPGCDGPRVHDGYCQLCRSNQTAIHHPPTSAPGEENQRKINQQSTGLTDRQESESSEQEGSLLESGSKCNAETMKITVLKGPEDKIACASPMCNTLIYPPNKLCQNCIDILRQSQALQQQQQRSYVEQLQPTVVSLKQEELPGSARSSGRSNNSAPLAVRQHMVKVPLAESQRPNSAPVGRRCLTPGCSRFGDPSAEGRCSACWTRIFNHGSIAASPDLEASTLGGGEQQDPFHAMMARIVSQKRSPKHCKMSGCTNFGNPNSEGFCNSCYPSYLQITK
ncbi:LOW QUALITY PROTEIN: tumor necrosis factor alpha-induced protein 3-like [Haliotis rubra]|uniref:LOW QUALITY PROTEIN: tumor necrosis factor alpha-induced protein 3-like n=1 Tax=Haliotis rubra TaxID=36100 RepID=UPI001EE55882|nr:LOW QUALITY PROTEIN: tumor necrosis factor alpha-induced protein 3-like [Haliotis rubra]